MPKPVYHSAASLALSSVSSGVTKVMTGPWVSTLIAWAVSTWLPKALTKCAWKVSAPGSRWARSAGARLTRQTPSAWTVVLQVLLANGWVLGKPSSETTTARPSAMLGPLPGSASIAWPLSTMPLRTSLALMRLSSACKLSQVSWGAAVLTTHSPLLMSVLVLARAKPLGSTLTTTSYTPSLCTCALVLVSKARFSAHCLVLAL